jgi:hypothetical protein
MRPSISGVLDSLVGRIQDKPPYHQRRLSAGFAYQHASPFSMQRLSAGGGEGLLLVVLNFSITRSLAKQLFQVPPPPGRGMWASDADVIAMDKAGDNFFENQISLVIAVIQRAGVTLSE